MKSLSSPIIYLFLLFILLPVFVHPFPVSAGDQPKADISDIIITTSETDLLFFCTVKNSFTPEMIKGIRNGIPITFTFLIELDKVIDYWPDTTLTELTIHHTLTYDTLKEEYHIQLSEKNNHVVTTDSLAKAKEIMAELSGIKIIPRDKLIPDAPYALHVKAKLAKKKLPFNIHYLIPFISLWDFETDWRTIEFRY
ncbi:hypothetical protein BMS3Bbin14_00334 [bacterium BMS3Bbin14]|nr:hypothetical protein BMS3Abin13_00711 [bacterium BMS3Abin13]GBE51877.1 hypothetical protein BMS3Bbin14_00334 [bacterium BMS3Bbin14]HDL98444.1 DUF4390 domain-containing protein [Desulfobacteraceae bacterium]HDO30102.1 DUF4390 domain-containing protein [Desulfobacteraceae bacterium]